MSTGRFKGTAPLAIGAALPVEVRLACGASSRTKLGTGSQRVKAVPAAGGRAVAAELSLARVGTGKAKAATSSCRRYLERAALRASRHSSTSLRHS